MLKTQSQLASLGQKSPPGAGGPGEDSPLLIIPAAGKKVQTGTPEVMEGGGGTKQQTAEEVSAAEAPGSQQPLNQQPRSVMNSCIYVCSVLRLLRAPQTDPMSCAQESPTHRHKLERDAHTHTKSHTICTQPL